LLSEFTSTLKQLAGNKPPPHLKKLLVEIRTFDRKWDSDEIDHGDAAEEAGHLLEEVQNELEHFAPPYGYFGSSEGDAADFGFWLSEDALQEAIHDGTLLQVDDTSDIPGDYVGEVLHVSDHGNPTLYVADKGTFTEVWGVV
jgi:hypothetical protein